MSVHESIDYHQAGLSHYPAFIDRVQTTSQREAVALARLPCAVRQTLEKTFSPRRRSIVSHDKIFSWTVAGRYAV